MPTEVKFDDIMPGLGEQATIIGQNGRGKSVWLKKMVEHYRGVRQIIVVDEKQDDIWDGIGEIVKNGLRLPRYPFPKYDVLVWRPDGEQADDFDLKDSVFEWIYQRGHTVLAVDEAARAAKSPLSPGRGLNDLNMRGRKRDITRLYGMQRASNVPRTMISESRRFYVKAVVDKRDREIIAAFAGPRAKEPIPDQYGMLYVDIAKDKTFYFPNPPK